MAGPELFVVIEVDSIMSCTAIRICFMINLQFAALCRRRSRVGRPFLQPHGPQQRRLPRQCLHERRQRSQILRCIEYQPGKKPIQWKKCHRVKGRHFLSWVPKQNMSMEGLSKLDYITVNTWWLIRKSFFRLAIFCWRDFLSIYKKVHSVTLKPNILLVKFW